MVCKQRRKLFHTKLRERCGTLDVKMTVYSDKWRTPQQIQCFFSRLSSQQRRNELQLNEDDAEALDERLRRTQIRNKVFSSVNINHPATYKHLYSLLKQGTLAKSNWRNLKKSVSTLLLNQVLVLHEDRRRFRSQLPTYCVVTPCSCAVDAD